MPVTLTGRLLCATPDDAAAVRDALPAHVAATRGEPGCELFEVTPDPVDPLIWQVVERFRDLRAFEAHQVRTRNSPWFAAAGHIPRDFEIEG